MNELRVLSLYLEGFAKIHTGMHIDRLFLDFDNMPNHTYLFVGDSGSGKSSTLKSIHPFAFNSNAGDETSNSDLIMSGRDGKKIIEYRLNNDIYTCKHLYLRKSDGTIGVKSYFSINGEELNPSGLVSTFKELVLQYFYIDESFLTLLALGNSVRSMVDFTSGERKKLSVKIFTELNIYMTYYKNASAVVKDLKSVLNNVIDKLDRYGDYDKNELKKSIKELNTSIDLLQEELDGILINEGSVNANIEANMKDYAEYESKQEAVTELFERVEELKRKRKTNKDYVILENDRESVKSVLIDADLRKTSLENNIKSELEFKEIKLKTKEQLIDSIDRMKNNTDETELEKLLANIDAELTTLSDVETSKSINYKEKKDQLVKANIYLDELKSMAVDLVSEVSMTELIPDILKAFISDKDFERKLDITYEAIVERLNNLKIANNITGDIKVTSISYPKCNDEECPYKRFYNDVYSIVSTKKESANKILKVEETKLHETEEKITIRRILKKLYTYIDAHNDILKYVPTEIFDPSTFVNRFLDGFDREVYDRDLMGSTVTYLERATRKEELLILKDTTINQLNGINNTKELYESLKTDLEQVNRAIEETESVIKSNQDDLEYNRNKIIEYSNTLKDLDNEIAIAKELKDVRGEIKEIQKNLSSMEELRVKHDELDKEIKSLKLIESELRGNLSEHRDKLNSVKNTLDMIESLEREKLTLAERYSEAVIIKDAVSPTKGIPVEFIDDVIRNQMIDSINELMHVAYPDITLLKDKDHLIINDKEFTIPYKKNGVIIGDISEASDGERAMLSLAFSLVLIRLVSKVYNIMLLDEMDTALDKYGRTKYIDIIEQYMTTINASQIFLISHNSMFDMYNVNILETTDSNISSNTDSMVVSVYKQNFTPDEYK